ncbi:MAG: hypothetical protein ACI9NQ_000631 [Paracoccaceae bacterium]|jgi:hypothetical protein
MGYPYDKGRSASLILKARMELGLPSEIEKR